MASDEKRRNHATCCIRECSCLPGTSSDGDNVLESKISHQLLSLNSGDMLKSENHQICLADADYTWRPKKFLNISPISISTLVLQFALFCWLITGKYTIIGMI